MDKSRFTIRKLVTDKENVVNVTSIRPFHHDPAYITPLNSAVNDNDKTVVDMIVQHDFSDPKEKWFVRWITDPSSEIWGKYENFKNVDAFHHYCATHKLDPFSPKLTPQFSNSVPNMSRWTATGQFTFPPVELTVTVSTLQTTNVDLPVRRTRGRPKQGPQPEDT